MYKAIVRTLIRRNIDALNRGDPQPALRMFSADGSLSFPGSSSWSRQLREPQMSRARFDTHRGRTEVEAFLARYVETGIQMSVEDILVNGGPWRTRAAVRAHVWVPGADGTDVYSNRVVLMVDTRWGKILHQEDYEDTERAAAFDEVLASSSAVPDPSGDPSTEGDSEVATGA